MWRYRQLLPIKDPGSIVSLGEGMTPLRKSALPARAALYIKDETRNPTGSMKDRALAVAFSKGKEAGVRRSIIASTGSAGLSAAAYAARAGMANVVVVGVEPPYGRVLPMQVYGSRLCELGGDVDREVLPLVKQVAERHGIYHVSTWREANPYQSEGAKTIAFEVFEQLGDVPDWMVVPVGGAGTLAAIWRGFRELQRMGLAQRLPRLVAVQVAHFDTFARAEAAGITSWEEAETLLAGDEEPSICVKIAHKVPPDGRDGFAAVRESGGRSVSVTDGEALAAVAEIGRADGVFVEPSSAVVWAALQKLEGDGTIGAGERVVMLLSGSGFRELEVIHHGVQFPRFRASVEDGEATLLRAFEANA